MRARIVCRLIGNCSKIAAGSVSTATGSRNAMTFLPEALHELANTVMRKGVNMMIITAGH